VCATARIECRGMLLGNLRCSDLRCSTAPVCVSVTCSMCVCTGECVHSLLRAFAVFGFVALDLCSCAESDEIVSVRVHTTVNRLI
jgi:hypothetical protein